MNNINEYGKLYTSDVLIVGGGMGGLVTAIKTKETNPDLDILVVDRTIIGWAGQSTKAGNGIRATSKAPGAIPKALGYLVNSHTEFLNDQEFLLKYLEAHKECIEYAHHCGIKVSVNEKGDVEPFDMLPGIFSAAGIEINACVSLRNKALELGIRLLNHVNIFEFLTSDSGKVIGAIGFDMEKGICHIFHSKATAMVTQGCHFKKIGLEFMGYGTGVGAAYRAGAVMRNVEFSTQTDIVFKKTNTPIYGGFNIIYNGKGENLKDKYCGKAPLMEVDTRLVLGMLEEVKLGNTPIWCDLEHPDEVRKIIGGQDHSSEMRMLKDKIAWEKHVFETTSRACGDVGLQPETTIKMVLQVEPVKVDAEYKTDVEGLWAPGKVSTQGCAYFGWTRGDGVGNAVTTGMMAGPSIAKYAAEASFDDIRIEQVKEYKEKIYAPLNRNSNHKPKEIFDKIERYIFQVDKLLAKSEESIKSMLQDVKDMKKIIPELTADDPHTLAKCLEAADTVLCLEMVCRAALERRESRGQMYPHFRVDYPEHDDKNWLKWINLKMGKDGQMELFTEDIPMWRYGIRPEGYTIPEGHHEEFYTPDNPLAMEMIELKKQMAAMQ